MKTPHVVRAAAALLAAGAQLLTPGCSPAQDAIRAMGLTRAHAEFSGDQSGAPFELQRGVRIYVPATVAGKTVSALLDSGAGMTTIDTTFAQTAGIKTDGQMSVQGTGGVRQAGIAHHLNITVAGMTLSDATVLVLDLGGIAEQIGRPLLLILGREVFDAAVVEIDSPNRRMSLSDPANFPTPSGATLVPLKTAHGGVRSVPVAVEGKSPLLVDFDLGHGGALTLGPAYWRAAHLLDGKRTTTTLGGGVGGLVEEKVALVGALDFAGVRFTDVPVQFSEQDGLAQTLGMRVLGRFHLWIDYPHDRLFLTASPGAASMPFPKDRSGLGAVFAPDRLKVVFVAPDSPAMAAGLKVGDAVTALDGAQIRPGLVDSPQAEWAARPAGTVVHLTLADGRVVSLTLADYY